MKLSGLLFCFIVMMMSFPSCTKTTTEKIYSYDTTTILTRDTIVIRDTVVITAPKNPIVGLWVGALTAVNEPQAGDLYYSIDIRTDGTILTAGNGADGNTYYSAGTWSITGNNFTATVTSTTLSNKGVVQNITLTYNQTAGTLKGTWQNQLLDASGTLSLNRVN